MTFALGIAAALASPLVMTIGFVVWQDHWKGSAFGLNLFKCVLSSAAFLVTVVIMKGVVAVTTAADQSVTALFPADVFTTRAVGFLILSSLMGIVIGDVLWLRALQLLGARRVILVDSLKPFAAAVFGYILLDEQVRLVAAAGIAVTVAGILIVSLEEEEDEERDDDNDRAEDEDGGDNSERTFDRTGGTEHATGVTAALPVTGLIAPEVKQVDQQKSVPPMSTPRSTVTAAAAVTRSDAAVAATVGDTATTTTTSPPSKDDEEEDGDGLPPLSPNHSSNPNATTPRKTARHQLWTGYSMSLVNCILDTYGSVLTKEHGKGMTVWEINLIRFGFAGATLLAVSAVMVTMNFLRRTLATATTTADNESPTTTSTLIPNGNDDDDDDETKKAAVTNDAVDSNRQPSSSSSTMPSSRPSWYALPLGSNNCGGDDNNNNVMTRSSWLHVTAGVALVSFLTPTLSNYALFEIALALTLTLTSVGPLYALPLSYCMAVRRNAAATTTAASEQQQHQRPVITLRALVGAVLAVAGIAVLAFWGTLPDDDDVRR